MSQIFDTKTDYRFRYAEIVRSKGREWEQFARALDEFGDISRKSGIPIALILFPPMREVPEVTPVVHQAVSEYARQVGLIVIDLISAFSGLDASERVVSEIDTHPSPAAHQIAAQRIYEGLQKGRLIPCS